MRAYYNEIDPFAAAWLRELMADGLIMAGDVDDRSITDVEPADLVGYTRCHFFAGIGGWDYALRLAGWPEDWPVWTGSCPCQPFSAAGKGEGFNDPRHLWPAFFRLIRESRPLAVFGEQVSSNLAWLDLVCGDLEGEGYAVGSVIVGAHSVGAPHLRQRLYWVAESLHAERRSVHESREDGRNRADTGREEAYGVTGTCSEVHWVGHATGAGSLPGAFSGVCGGEESRGARHGEPERPSNIGGLADAERWPAERRRHDVGGPAGGVQGTDGERERVRVDAGAGGDTGGLGDASGHGGPAGLSEPEPRDEGLAGIAIYAGGQRHRDTPWRDAVWLPCRDGKARPTQPGLQPLAHGVSNRVGLLRGAGNAIVPQAAAAFVRAYLAPPQPPRGAEGEG